MASKKTVKAKQAPPPADKGDKVVYNDGSYAENGKYYLPNGEYSGYDTLDDYFAMQEAMNGKGDSDGADNGVGTGVDAPAGSGSAEAGGADVLAGVQAASVVGEPGTVVSVQDDGIAGAKSASAVEGGRGKGEEAPAGTALGVTPLPAPDADLIAALGALYAQGNATIEYITNANALSDNDAAKLRQAQGHAYHAVLSCYGKLKENGK